MNLFNHNLEKEGETMKRAYMRRSYYLTLLSIIFIISFGCSSSTVFEDHLDSIYKEEGFNREGPVKPYGIQFQEKDLYHVTYVFPGNKNNCRTVDQIVLKKIKTSSDQGKSRFEIVMINRMFFGRGTPIMDAAILIFIPDKAIKLASSYFNDYCVEELKKYKLTGNMPDVISKSGKVESWKISVIFSGLTSGIPVKSVMYSKEDFDFTRDVINKYR
jgi:hypothetical protein